MPLFLAAAAGDGARKSRPIRIVELSLLVTMPGAEILPPPTTRTQTCLASPGLPNALAYIIYSGSVARTCAGALAYRCGAMALSDFEHLQIPNY